MLEVGHLTKTFVGREGLRRRPYQVHAVVDVSFRIQKHGALAIVGETGCGKTTCARLIVGLETPTSGRIAIDGVDTTRRPRGPQRRERARKLQMVFQNPYVSLDAHQTAREMLEETVAFHFGSTRSERSATVEALLDHVGLGAREARLRPLDLSGGQCQRLAIARALAPNPEILVLDEAVSALDVSVQAQILNLLSELRQNRGLTMLFISHDLAVVRQIADDVVVMHRGSVMEAGTVADVLASPRHPYTKRLVASVPRPGQPFIRTKTTNDDELDNMRTSTGNRDGGSKSNEAQPVVAIQAAAKPSKEG